MKVFLHFSFQINEDDLNRCFEWTVAAVMSVSRYEGTWSESQPETAYSDLTL